jgi:uncharacterized membrane protein YidH (DUF202 family)
VKPAPQRLHAPPFDPGLQGERTALAWNRTALAIAVSAVLELRISWSLEQHVVTALAAALLISAAVTFVHGSHRRRQLLRGGTPPRAHSIWIGLTASAALLAAVVACVSLIQSAL